LIRRHFFEILSIVGKWMTDNVFRIDMASITDVAAEAGVSTASVSRVLAGKTVRPEVRRRVDAAVAALGYRPNRAARQLRSNRSTTIGLLVADIQNPYFTQICRAVEGAATEAGYAVLLCNSDERIEREAAHLQLLQEENVAGVIVAPTSVVLIDRTAGRGRADAVVIDNIAAAADLAGHLLDHGYRRVAGVFGAHSETGRLRHEGFVAAHATRGLKPIKSLAQSVPSTADGAAPAVAALLDAKPDAILTTNGLLAEVAFRAIAASGRRVPFATFDDPSWASLVEPAVTVLAQPTAEIGRTAVELLLARIAEPDRPTRSVMLPHRLIVRASCGCRSS
jgi:LacI family fructose operon transcriptional repressor